MMPQVMKERPKKPQMLKHSPQANQTQKSLIQKTNFATTPKKYDYMSVRHNVISDPPTIKLGQFINVTNGTPSVVWPQQME